MIYYQLIIHIVSYLHGREVLDVNLVNLKRIFLSFKKMNNALYT